MSLRSRPTPPPTEPSTTDPSTTAVKPPPPPPSAVSQTLTITANLANLLPTGTLLAFQLLTPIFTSNGACDSATASLTLLLLLFLSASCFLASFTDSFKSSSNNQIYYGFATIKGMFLFDYPSSSSNGIPDLSKYRLRFIDWVHAILSVLVFGAVAFRDKNVVKCLYPSPGHETEEVLDIVPIAIGLICSLLFVVFPTRRHGIGCPVSP
ncbi:hypothetical protein ACSBR2_018659 [Camellia fascicularis]